MNILRKHDYGRNPPIGLKSLLNIDWNTIWAVLRCNLEAFCQVFTLVMPLVLSKDPKEYLKFANESNTYQENVQFIENKSLYRYINTLKWTNKIRLRDIIQLKSIGQCINFIIYKLHPFILSFLILLILFQHFFNILDTCHYIESVYWLPF